MPDKCKKAKDCGCGCAKKQRRKRAAKPKAKSYAAAPLVGYGFARGAPFMSPLNGLPAAAPAPAAAPSLASFHREGIEADLEELRATRDPEFKAKLRRSIQYHREQLGERPPARRGRPPRSRSPPAGPSIRMMPQPSAPVGELPIPTGPSIRMMPQPSAPVAELLALESAPAFTPAAPSAAKPRKERKAPVKSEDIVRPSNMGGIAMAERAKVGRKAQTESRNYYITGEGIEQRQPEGQKPPKARPALERITNPASAILPRPKTEHLTQRGEQRAFIEEERLFVEPAPLSRPAMMGQDLQGTFVKTFSKAGGDRRSEQFKLSKTDLERS